MLGRFYNNNEPILHPCIRPRHIVPNSKAVGWVVRRGAKIVIPSLESQYIHVVKYCTLFRQTNLDMSQDQVSLCLILAHITNKSA